MAPAQHLLWLADNVDWFSALDIGELDVDVPACPGWTVGSVVNHLAFGLGLAYPYALRSAPDCPHDDAFADVPWPETRPTGGECIASFDREMGICIDVFRATEPETPCYTYEGPGIASFWFRRAAIETTLHRMDVVDALGVDDVRIDSLRLEDAIAETAEFALPIAALWSDSPLSAISIKQAEGSARFVLGDGPVEAQIVGEGDSLLAALWGRSTENVEIQGDRAAAMAWMSVVKTAFAGRA